MNTRESLYRTTMMMTEISLDLELVSGLSLETRQVKVLALGSVPMSCFETRLRTVLD